MIAPVQTARGSESWRSNADLAAKSMWIVDVFNTNLNLSPGMLCITCGSSIPPFWTSTPSKFIPPSFKFKQLGMAVVVASPPIHSLWPQGPNQKTASFEALKKCLLAPSQVPLDICEGFSHSEDEMAIITDINPFCVEVAFKVIGLMMLFCQHAEWSRDPVETIQPTESSAQNHRKHRWKSLNCLGLTKYNLTPHPWESDFKQLLSAWITSGHCKAYIITLAWSQGASRTEPKKHVSKNVTIFHTKISSKLGSSTRFLESLEHPQPPSKPPLPSFLRSKTLEVVFQATLPATFCPRSSNLLGQRLGTKPLRNGIESCHVGPPTWGRTPKRVGVSVLCQWHS